MDLTDEQQKQLRDLHEKYQIFLDDTYEMRADIVSLDQKIRMYMETSNPDSAKLKSMVMEKSDLAADLDVKRMEFALDSKKIAPELKYIPMGMDSGFYGPGMGYGPRGNGHGHRGFYGPCMNEALPNN